ncbi:antibiotic biosynthesis monooxygenase family protein [Kurthia huakuii]|uniref:antibiotic biosynthesis monooxygenase family protein n=1 Tax=Kurthia huakuii TaxID=1421019 RepID=UPI000498599D|nr:antibiotic biosynthesis monooxygenase family protein [Kurthia huakuii]MBM7699600.1 heme-degrading monooxygenase HmoA [Kurthia huakuii]
MTNLYIAIGTADFMQTLQGKYKKEQMILAHNDVNSILLHETDKKTKFAAPKKYNIVASEGQLEQHGYFALIYVSLMQEQHQVFEDRFKQRQHGISQEPGFVAFRLLRPLNDTDYVVLTEWTGAGSFEAWKLTNDYQEAIASYQEVGTLNMNSQSFEPILFTKTYTTNLDDVDFPDEEDERR